LGGKLVRDKIPTVAPGAYVKCDGSERLEWLKKKLVEEALEFLIEPSVEELADVLEVVKALIDVFGDEVYKVAESKRKELGGFEECWIRVTP